MTSVAILNSTILRGALTLLLCCGCAQNSCVLEPSICYIPPVRVVNELPSAFPPLSSDEMRYQWGSELLLGLKFTSEADYYRAITCLKRASFIVPSSRIDRRLQIEYSIFQCYYLGCKYNEAIEVFETGLLHETPADFPALRELKIMLYDSYIQTDQTDKACKILDLLDAETGGQLQTSTDFQDGRGNAPDFLACYEPFALSVKKAQTFNAILPGAGYYYVGQKKSALTSFVINAVFIAASAHFFQQGNYGAGLIFASLETGWYFGGINGAGIEAKVYNERLYERCAKDYMIQNKLFPVLMFNYAF